MVAVRMGVGLVDLSEKAQIDTLNGELTNVVNEFMRAVDVETLLLTKKNG